MQHQQSPFIFVTYDGIHNSVFVSQVLQPLIAQKKQKPTRAFHIISFERYGRSIDADVIQQAAAGGITLHTRTKLPFIGTVSLWFAQRKLRLFLQQFSAYELMARGPLAGYLCLPEVKSKACTRFTLQARGLLAEEYRYTIQKKHSLVRRWWHNWRAQQFENIEKTVYGNRAKKLTIQAVSPALKEHLVTQFGAQPERVTIATHDIPQAITQKQKQAWRTATRKELNIPDNLLVYCYNGSAKPWQCPQEVVAFFAAHYHALPNCFLLILTQEQAAFTQLVKQYNLPDNAYAMCTVAHAEIYQYLAAADIGIMLRHKHLLNWVSRPTKLLEYNAVGLGVVHNNTVGYLCDQ